MRRGRGSRRRGSRRTTVMRTINRQHHTANRSLPVRTNLPEISSMTNSERWVRSLIPRPAGGAWLIKAALIRNLAVGNTLDNLGAHVYIKKLRVFIDANQGRSRLTVGVFAGPFSNSDTGPLTYFSDTGVSGSSNATIATDLGMLWKIFPVGFSTESTLAVIDLAVIDTTSVESITVDAFVQVIIPGDALNAVTLRVPSTSQIPASNQQMLAFTHQQMYSHVAIPTNVGETASSPMDEAQNSEHFVYVPSPPKHKST